MTTTDIRHVAEPLLPHDDGHRRRRLVLALALVVVLGAVTVWVVAFSSVFGVGSVEVHGTRDLTGAEIEKAADVPEGEPLVRLDTAPIIERVEALPQVESAQVSTSFPSTVVITVTERTPVGYVTVAGRPVLVDHTGTQYLGVAKAPSGLPRLVLSSGTGRAVATVAASLPAALLARTDSVQALDRDAISVVLHSGVIVRWGSAARSETKARIVDVLSARKPRPDRIDVTDPERPFTN